MKWTSNDYSKESEYIKLNKFSSSKYVSFIKKIKIKRNGRLANMAKL